MASIANVDALDLSALRLFLDVVELASVSKAAARHHMTQPSATAKLHKLERQVGVRLLDRGPTGSVPTAAGVALVPACADLVAAARALMDSGDELRSEQRRLVVATTRHIAEHFLPGWVARWARDTAVGSPNTASGVSSPATRPGASSPRTPARAGSPGAAPGVDAVIDVIEADTRSVAAAVRSREAAIGFTDGPSAPIGLRSTQLATEQMVAVVAAGHPLAATRRPCSGRELVEQPLIVTRSGSGTRDVIEHAIAARGLSADAGRHEVANSAAVRLAAINGAGVGLLPRCRVDDDLRTGLLVALPLADLVILQPVRAVWRGTRPAQLPARRLLQVAQST